MCHLIAFTCCPPIFSLSKCFSYSLFFLSVLFFLYHSLFIRLKMHPPFPSGRDLPPLQTPGARGLILRLPACLLLHTSHTSHTYISYIRALSIVPKWAARSALQGSACCSLLAGALYRRLLPSTAIYCLLGATGHMIAAVNHRFGASQGLCWVLIPVLLMPSPRKACFWPLPPLASFCPLFAR